MKVMVLHNADLSGIKPRSYPQDKAMIQTLRQAGHEVQDNFYVPEILEQLGHAEMVFNLCDSFNDGKEEYFFVRKLEEKKVPFTGCTSETIFNCLNKYRLKLLLEKKGIKVPRAQLFVSSEQQLELEFPLIVKPAQSNASVGIEEDSVVSDLESFLKKLSGMLREFGEVMAEEYIGGREFCITMIGNEQKLFPILEIDYNDEYFLDKPKVLSYKAKWSKNSNVFKHTYSLLAAGLTEEETKNIQETALKAFKALECCGYASVDLRMNDKGEVYVLEVNPNAYLAPESDLAKSAWISGMSYDQLLNQLIEFALERAEKLAVKVAVPM